MTNVYRECFTCGASFLFSEMERHHYSGWNKIIYFCKDCSTKLEAEEKIGAINPSFTDYREPTTFAEKYKSLNGKKEWWDK